MINTSQNLQLLAELLNISLPAFTFHFFVDMVDPKLNKAG